MAFKASRCWGVVRAQTMLQTQYEGKPPEKKLPLDSARSTYFSSFDLKNDSINQLQRQRQQSFSKISLSFAVLILDKSNIFVLERRKCAFAYIYRLLVQTIEFKLKIIIRMSLLAIELKRLQEKQGVKFKSGFLNLGAKKYITSQNMSILRNPQRKWQLDGMVYASQEDKWTKIFQFMTQCKVQSLLLGGNYKESILKQIRQPVYFELQQLILCTNNLKSIEILQFFQFSKLQSLDLSSNYLVSVKPLNKLVVPLRVLNLSDNPIRDIEKLQRSSFIRLRCLHLESKHRSPVIGESLRWLLKFPSPLLQQLSSASRKRMRQSLLLQQLRKCYRNGKIKLA